MLQKYSLNEILFGVLYFLVHFCLELVCYRLLYLRFSSYVSILVIFIYDFFAFVPQVIIGNFHNKYKYINIGIIGVICFVISLLLINNDFFYYIAIFILSIGNAFLHETGAIATISISNKHIFPSSLFVSGGAFGIFAGRMMAKANISLYWLFIPIFFILLVILFTSNKWCIKNIIYTEFDITKNIINHNFVILVVFVVVAVRSYIGMIMPMAWKKTIFDMFLMYISLGIGKALGGLFCDIYGYRFTTIISTLVCIPFIIFGNYNIVLSLIGVLLFSMNMSITYALALNIIRQNPGVAFGVTTIALFVGILPIFIFKLNFNIIVLIVIVLSFVCYYLLNKILR